MAEENHRVKEEVRLVRWRMAHENVRFADEFRIIPGWIKGLTITQFIVGEALALLSPLRGSATLGVRMAVMAAVMLVIGFLLLLFGYINRDAKRRGMNSTLWTLLAIFVPYLIGLIIYFLIREPLPYSCPGCGASVNARFNFCPGCKHDLRPSCPQCKREVRSGDKYCPYCAQELAPTQSPPETGLATLPPAE